MCVHRECASHRQPRRRRRRRANWVMRAKGGSVDEYNRHMHVCVCDIGWTHAEHGKETRDNAAHSPDDECDSRVSAVHRRRRRRDVIKSLCVRVSRVCCNANLLVALSSLVHDHATVSPHLASSARTRGLPADHHPTQQRVACRAHTQHIYGGMWPRRRRRRIPQ